MNPIIRILNVFRLPLDLVMWLIDFLRVTRFVFSAGHKISDRCPFGCYRPESVVKAGLRKCPAARRYGNFWVFRTLCKCARKPENPIPGVPAYCRERGNFEISFKRWATVTLTGTMVIGGCAYAFASGFISRQIEVASEVASPATFRALREVAAPRVVAPPRRPTPAVKGKPEFQVDEVVVATSEVSLRTTIKQALTTPENLAIRVRLARGYYTLGMAGDAQKLLKDCLAADPGYAPATAYLALYELARGDVAAAKAMIGQVPGEGQPSSALAPVALLVANASGETTQVSALQQQLGASPEPLAALARAIVAKESLGPQRFISLAKDFPDLSGLMGELLVVGSDSTVIDRAVRVAADETLAAGLRGAAVAALWARGQRSRASELADAIVRQHPDAIGAQVVRFEVLLAAEAPDRAIAVARGALKLAPSPVDGLPLKRRLARTLQAIGESRQALTAWLEVREVGPDPEADTAIASLRRDN